MTLRLDESDETLNFEVIENEQFSIKAFAEKYL
jgi:hypothetical protein